MIALCVIAYLLLGIVVAAAIDVYKPAPDIMLLAFPVFLWPLVIVYLIMRISATLARKLSFLLVKELK